MAACLITTGGTSGTLRIDYTVSGDANVLFSSHGDLIYIPDSATGVTYTTLTGNVTAASGCVSITERTIDYYTITYDRLKNDQSTYASKFDAIIIDGVTTALSPTISDKLTGYGALIEAINTTLDDDDIKIVGFLAQASSGSTNYYDVSLLFRLLDATGSPMLRINSHYNHKSYLIGTTSVAEPVGYTLIDIPVVSTPAP